MNSGLRRRYRKRTKELRVSLGDDEYELLMQAARYTDDFTATWARDVLVSRALQLHRQRNLID